MLSKCDGWRLQVTYGPLVDVQAFAEKMAFEHYKNNAPFLTVYDVWLMGMAVGDAVLPLQAVNKLELRCFYVYFWGSENLVDSWRGSWWQS